MNVTITVDSRQFNSAVKAYMEVSNRTLAQVINQSLYDIAWSAANYLKIAGGGPDQKRMSIRQYMWQALAVYIKVNKAASKRAGRTIFKVRGTYSENPGRKRASRQLHRVNLIVQKLRKKQGKRTLGGKKDAKEMRQMAGRFAGTAQNAVKFVTLPFKDALYAMDRYVKIRKSLRTIWGKKMGISIWPNNTIRGGVIRATSDQNPQRAEMRMKWNIRTNVGFTTKLINDAVQHGIDERTADLLSVWRRRMQEDANRFNARKVS